MSKEAKPPSHNRDALLTLTEGVADVVIEAENALKVAEEQFMTGAVIDVDRSARLKKIVKSGRRVLENIVDGFIIGDGSKN